MTLHIGLSILASTPVWLVASTLCVRYGTPGTRVSDLNYVNHVLCFAGAAHNDSRSGALLAHIISQMKQINGQQDV